MHRNISILLTLIGLPVFGWCGDVRADVIAVRGSAAVQHRVVRLQDVAVLTGREAERLGPEQIAVLGAKQTQLTLTLVQLRERLKAHDPNWGRLVLRGPLRFELRLVTAPAPETGSGTVQANPRIAIEVARAVDAFGASTVGQHLCRWVRQRAGDDGDDPNVQIVFDDATDPVLGRDVHNGRYEFECLSRNLVGRVPVSVRHYTSDGKMTTTQIRLRVRRRSPVVLMNRSLGRGQIINADDVRLETVWLDSPTHGPLHDVASAVGNQVRGIVRSGSILTADDIEAPIVIKRGQLIRVSCIEGALVVKTMARAMENGEAGQWISVRSVRAGTRDTYRVRVSGPQEAVLIIDTPKAGSQRSIDKDKK